MLKLEMPEDINRNKKVKGGETLLVPSTGSRGDLDTGKTKAAKNGK